MDRRTFLTFTAATAALPLGAQAMQAMVKEYTPGMVKEALANGETVVVDFKTEWCSTCAAQQRTLAALRKENPAYGENITFISVDWDVYGKSEMAKAMKIPRRSTVVALKGDKELARIVAGTRKTQLQELLDAALNAAIA